MGLPLGSDPAQAAGRGISHLPISGIEQQLHMRLGLPDHPVAAGPCRALQWLSRCHWFTVLPGFNDVDHLIQTMKSMACNNPPPFFAMDDAQFTDPGQRSDCTRAE